MRVEKASMEERDAHHTEIIRSDNVVERPLHAPVIRRLGFSIDPECAVVLAAERNRTPGLRDRLNPRSLGKFGVELPEDKRGRSPEGAQFLAWRAERPDPRSGCGRVEIPD